NYKFGVSLNTLHASSGISWTHCVVNPKAKVDKLRHVFSLTQSSTSILIQWDFLCEIQKKLVTFLEIVYCPKDNCISENKKHINASACFNDQCLVSGPTSNTTYI